MGLVPWGRRRGAESVRAKLGTTTAQFVDPRPGPVQGRFRSADNPHDVRTAGACVRQRFTIGRTAPIDDEGEWEDAFWRTHLYVGIGSFTLGALLLLVYLVLTPRGSHRVLLVWMVLTSIVVWWTVFGPVGARAIASQRRDRRDLFFFCWSLTTLTLIALSAFLDGGEKSPLSILLVLPVLFAGLVYPPRQVGWLAVLALGSFLALAASGGALPARAVVTGAMLGLTGAISVTAAVNRDIKDEARRRLATRLHDLATSDGLTGCRTHRSFGEALEAEGNRARRYGSVFSVVMVDIDSFKAINDTLGHDVGDATLRSVAAALTAAARVGDVTGRVGGDEFAVLLPETDHDQALQVTRRLQEVVRAARMPVPVTVSYGWSSWCGPTDTEADVRRRADQALYAAKRAGRDRLAEWDPNCEGTASAGPVRPHSAPVIVMERAPGTHR